MVSVTNKAKEMLSEALHQSREQIGSEDEAVAIRLATIPDGPEARQVKLHLALDNPREGDEIIANGDEKVLLVDPDTASVLAGATIDAVDTPEGRKLSIRT